MRLLCHNIWECCVIICDTTVSYYMRKSSGKGRRLETERRHFGIRLIILYHARIAFFGAGQVAEAGNGYRFTQVDNHLMRVFGTSGCAPEDGFLQVVYLVGCEVAAVGFFAVGVGDLPVLASERVAVFVEQIEFGNSGVVATVLRVQCFEAEMAGLHGGVEPDFLPAVAGF